MANTDNDNSDSRANTSALTGGNLAGNEATAASTTATMPADDNGMEFDKDMFEKILAEEGMRMGSGDGDGESLGDDQQQEATAAAMNGGHHHHEQQQQQQQPPPIEVPATPQGTNDAIDLRTPVQPSNGASGNPSQTENDVINLSTPPQANDANANMTPQAAPTAAAATRVSAPANIRPQSESNTQTAASQPGQSMAMSGSQQNSQGRMEDPIELNTPTPPPAKKAQKPRRATGELVFLHELTDEERAARKRPRNNESNGGQNGRQLPNWMINKSKRQNGNPVSRPSPSLFKSPPGIQYGIPQSAYQQKPSPQQLQYRQQQQLRAQQQQKQPRPAQPNPYTQSRSLIRPQLKQSQSKQYYPNGGLTFHRMPQSFKPTWRNLVLKQSIESKQITPIRYFELSLLSLSEFTITGLPSPQDGIPCSTDGLGPTIRKLSKQYGKATYDKQAEPGSDEGRWRIPLEAYNEFFAFLAQSALYRVTGIPRHQLNLASLGKAQRQQGFPSASALVLDGVPPRLATTLAPFQRGGVNFVKRKDGRALIADDMGLGKTIQSIAAISMYHQEWPVLVLTPSSARYHWENEFLQWLGPDSQKQAAKKSTPDSLRDDKDGMANDEDLSKVDTSKCMNPLKPRQVHVLTTSKEAVLPFSSTKVVVVSYGLAPALVEQNKIQPGLFRCAIVDESHMLKNVSARRTKLLVPVLRATSRCILLSGTPAFARPIELWPQLNILGTEKEGWWSDEADFVRKYVKKSTPARRAELHALLTGTVMIRRLKNEILKTLPKKYREKAMLDVLTAESRQEMHKLMMKLREGKGVLGKLAKEHSSVTDAVATKPPVAAAGTIQMIDREYSQRMFDGQRQIQYAMATTHSRLNQHEKMQLQSHLLQELQQQLYVWRKERMHDIHNQLNDDSEDSRTGTLNKMYKLTAECKIPVIVSLVKRWLDDPAKGKLCLFAHHLFVLNEVMKQVGLSNLSGSKKKYIRIDGSTSPKDRQAQIKQFQSDPTIRIAVLGITAAGVAVTLTASSTVWFTELFWTPALMIQAEDRCHRIGQSTRVQCVYFVAEGTLDELLWRLLAKKFQDLGEFVEGKEKLKLVVHKEYKNLPEFVSTFRTSSDFDEDEEKKSMEDLSPASAKQGDENDDFDIMGELDLEGDLEKLAQAEMRSSNPTEDFSGNDTATDRSTTADTAQSEDAVIEVEGATEAEAIELSDDDEDDNAPAVAAAVAPGGGTVSAATAPVPRSINSNGNFNAMGDLGSCQTYTLRFFGPKYGFELFLFHGRLIVSNRKETEPTAAKPTVGDILVMVNKQHVPLVRDINQFTPYMKSILGEGPVDLAFVESADFVSYFRQHVLHNIEQEKLTVPNAPVTPNAVPSGGGQPPAAAAVASAPTQVIEILDD